MTFDAISEPIAKRVTAGLAKIALALKSRAWKGAGGAGVTPTQGQALGLLREAPKGLRLSALAELLGVSAPTASDAVNSLVSKGLAAKEAGPDKRSIALKLTPAGKTLADRTDEWPDFLTRAVESLEPDEQAGFLRSLVKIVRALQENGDIPLQRMCITCRHFRPNVHDDVLNPHHCAYVDAAFGDRHLRLNCAEQEEAPAEQRSAAWERFRVPAAAPL
ncbi:MarR family transcriptional regulator [Mesorhizobium sp. L-8-10]|uniref:MarR family winged helix-turn-helix transcriptional regulator n=1 Tax=unclassified Mesorhizobium TaxID=325217 RepID=UPI0019297E06|nr:MULTISPECIES: MarR family winged helix-turn-helix transcriptional regulator [unclassified Mesorhizobium]BCH22070.1 MarR family transcriptional regulator [Mesorhizobium sp. L-8-3]BCH29765.1 MarR family transcriptional regulator [Mesorhizobium sp. L-8-10]